MDGITGRTCCNVRSCGGRSPLFGRSTLGLDPAVKEAQKRAEKLADEYERSNREIDTNIGVIKLYADELANLAPKEQKTAEDKEKIKFFVEELNDLMPDLNLAYDEQADKLNISTEEIDKYIESLEKQLRMEAGRKYLKEIYEEQIRLQLELKNKRDEVTEADRRWYEAIMQHAPGSRARNNLMEDYVKIMGLWSEKSAPYVSLNEAMATAERKLVYEVSEITKQSLVLTIKSRSTEKQHRTLSGLSKKNGEKVDTAQEARFLKAPEPVCATPQTNFMRKLA